MNAVTHDGEEPAANTGSKPDPVVYPEELARLEADAVASRRSALGLQGDRAEVGLALSGGGIRSATFALGLLQAFARHQRLKHIDFLSTVSGGGYTGAFLGKLFVAGARSVDTPEECAEHVRRTLADPGSPSLRWLREHGRYIAPNGGGDYFLAAAIYLRNWVAVQYVVGVSLLAVFLCALLLRGWVRALGLECDGGVVGGLLCAPALPWLWPSPWLTLPALVAGLSLVPLSLAYWLTQDSQRHHGQPTVLNLPLLGLLAIMGVALVALLANLGTSHPIALGALSASPLSMLAAGVLLTGCLGIACLWLSRQADGARRGAVSRNLLSRWLGKCLLLFTVLAVFALVDSAGQTAFVLWSSAEVQIGIVGGLTSALVLLVRLFASALGGDASGSRKLLRLPARLLGFIAGVSLALIVATFWSAIAHAIAWGGERPGVNAVSCVLEHYVTVPAEVPLTCNRPVLAEVLPGALAGSPPTPPSGGTVSRPRSAPDTHLLGFACAFALLVCWLTGHTRSFLNLSSLQQFYAARLTRAYLGAGNPQRHPSGRRFGNQPAGSPQQPDDDARQQPGDVRDVTAVVAGDDESLADYRPERCGGPLHLVNVTINETVSGAGQLSLRDRKGMGMAIGPFGLSVARRHHALWQPDADDLAGNDFRRLEPLAPADGFCVFGNEPVKVEALSLGRWVAISGAAFSTGLGARTNLGLSLLLGFSNVRLGYWWDSNISPRRRRKSGMPGNRSRRPSDPLESQFAVQLYLCDEFIARFHGPHRQRWYLSDGGHFENNALYELLRRRLPFIIASDNGADPSYRFEDFAGLIRKARMDFNAEIEFVEASELDRMLSPQLRHHIGTPAELRRAVQRDNDEMPDGHNRFAGHAYSSRHACLARVRYDGAATPGGLILLVKPAVTGSEPLDLLEYHATHADFPQQTTLDQFFDEAQWESYRKLGEFIGEQLMDPAHCSDGRWAPCQMRPPA